MVSIAWNYLGFAAGLVDGPAVGFERADSCVGRYLAPSSDSLSWVLSKRLLGRTPFEPFLHHLSDDKIRHSQASTLHARVSFVIEMQAHV